MGRRRILVVEDDAALAAMYEMALRDAGFDVELAGDGLTALSAIDDEHPDLVVLDVHLPQLDGRTILRELATTADTRAIPVIVVTGADESELRHASAVIRKPCDPRALVALVSQQFQRFAA